MACSNAALWPDLPEGMSYKVFMDKSRSRLDFRKENYSSKVRVKIYLHAEDITVQKQPEIVESRG